MNVMYVLLALLRLRKDLRPLHGWLALAGGGLAALAILRQREVTSSQSERGQTTRTMMAERPFSEQPSER
jgi:hypothetical protein